MQNITVKKILLRRSAALQRLSQSLFTSCKISSQSNMSPLRTASILQKVEEAESKLLSILNTPFVIRQVKAGDIELHTIVVNPEHKGTPLVLLHGFGCSSAGWVTILDRLAEQRPVFCIDLPGWGLSSRNKIPGNPSELDFYYVEKLEEWRKAEELEKFIIVGYSLGAYFSICYTLSHQERIQKLILIDPWGVAEKPERIRDIMGVQSRLGIYIVRKLASKISPFSIVRTCGIFGRCALESSAKPLLVAYKNHPSEDFIKTEIIDYIYFCFRLKPTGESVHKRLNDGSVYAKYPLLSRLQSLTVPMLIIHAEDSYIPRASEQELRSVNPDVKLDIRIVPGTTHDDVSVHPQIPEIIIEKCLEEENETGLVENTIL